MALILIGGCGIKSFTEDKNDSLKLLTNFIKILGKMGIFLIIEML